MGKTGKTIKRLLRKADVNADVVLNYEEIARVPEENSDPISLLSGQKVITHEMNCSMCNVRYTTVEQMTEHVQIDRNKRNTCYISYYQFAKSKEENVNIVALCPVKNCCSRRYHSIEEYTKHLSETHQDYRQKQDVILIYKHMGGVENILSCKSCGITFSRKDNKVRHEKKCGGAELFQCVICAKTFSKLSEELSHIQSTHKPKTSYDVRLPLELGDPGMNRNVGNFGQMLEEEQRKIKILRSPAQVFYKIFSKLTKLDEAVSTKMTDELEREINHVLSMHSSINVSMFANVTLQRTKDDGTNAHMPGFLHTSRHRIHGEASNREVLDNLRKELISKALVLKDR